jgi:hypothetical protein
MDAFRSGKIKVLGATDIAARGIDVNLVSHVVNFDMPDTVEAYTHRIGRTGRAEHTGSALTLVTGEDEPLFDLAPQCVSIISGGGVDRRFTMPAMDKVVGGDSARFIYSDSAFRNDDPHMERQATAHFYFCGYRTMQDSGFRAFDF